MLKIAILGATGPTGKCLTKQALAAGHDVRAIVRNPSKLSDIQHKNFVAVQANIFDEEQLKSEFAQVDAVLSCLGSPPTSPWGEVTLYSNSIKPIINAMKATDRKRLICLTSAGQKIDERAGMMMKFFLKYVIGTILADMSRMEKYISENSESLEYTIIRPTGLTNDPLSEREPVVKEDIHFDLSNPMRIPRANVAKVMLQALIEDKWLNKTIFITMPN